MMKFLCFICLLISLNCFSQDGTALLPVPQKNSFTDKRYLLDDTWSLSVENITKSDPAVISLTDELKERFGIRLTKSPSAKIIQLKIKPGSVNIGATTDTNISAIKKQAYHIGFASNRITIIANAGAGLFYGVQTILQSLRIENGNAYYLGGEITDWPDMDLRMIYWDDAHHLERLKAMKRAIRQAAYYKINGFAVKLEGHFQFKSAKPIVEPYAYSPAELQELTDYAKDHYVELIPFLDAPAHISFILKHPEYSNLRSFPNSNYEASVIDPKSDELLLGMFNDLFNANKGGKYVVLSTDEAYYAGMSPAEKKRVGVVGSNGRLLAEYIARMANKLHDKGRTVIIWAEFPLKESDINTLSSHIVSGVYNAEWANTIRAHGMRQLIYTSAQGVEPLFPNYVKQPVKKMDRTGSLALTDDEEQQGELAKGRVGEVLNDITTTIADKKADLMGVIVAAWGDAGLNPETFWLGYAAGAAPGWNNRNQSAKDLSYRFYNSFYGSHIQMDSVYNLMSSQADFWDKSWDWEASNWRTPIFGNSYKIFDTAKPAKDQTLAFLPIPSSNDLSITTDWNDSNKERLLLAGKYLTENKKLMQLLNENMATVNFQHYNLQVLYSVAQVCRQNLHLLLSLKRLNKLLSLASKTSASQPGVAVSLIDEALDEVNNIRDDRNDMLQSVTNTWYVDWFPRVSEANGRKFLDHVDDVKDHQPIRTIDMSYLIYRQLKYPLGEWAKKVTEVRNEFARKHNLPVVARTFDWEKY